MAPRKRTTKPRKNNPKAAKLEAFLQDFNSEVETRVRQMRENLNQMLKDVDNSYNMALLKLPKAVRQTVWLDLIKSEKPKTPEVDDVKREEDAAIVESVGADDHAVLQKTVRKLMKKKKGETKSTSDDENVPSSSRKGRTTRKPQPTRTTSRAFSKQSRRSSRKPLVTPARTMLDSSLMMGSTPLITPRFDPRLPKTPAVRVARHKERVFSISVNGSPVAAGSQDVVLSVPVGNGESLQLLASQMDSVDMSLLDETALRSIRLLQTRLTALCGTSH
ncbi:borealin isoform X1 [Kryptolebias marmoratus]|uniref:borealin isoform X1 n=1 Tax=Kryptolebias marmoratus TaxID=37003 RepID=UPI0007F904D1|nr:borealin isoform X1 [Kryptolebias marmoratus]